jgi:peptide/nickel transport system permease protein
MSSLERGKTAGMSLSNSPKQSTLLHDGKADNQRLERARGVLRAIVRSKKATAGLIMVGLMVLAGLCAPLLTPYDPADMRAAKIFEEPSWQHPLGADEFGRDIFSRTLYGIRISLSVSLTVATLSIFFGVLLGMLAGYREGHIGSAIMALADFLFSLPTVLLALVAATILKPGLITVVIALSIVYTPQFLRLMRGATLKVSQQEFVQAARAVGVGQRRIILRHLLPNVISLLAVQTALVLSFVILDEAALSFIGVGTQPPTPSWGIMLREGMKNLYRAQHLSLFPGIAVTYAVLAFNLLGDGLQDIFDPHLSRTKKA